MSAWVWELVFMMIVLKLPILYLVGVVIWAVRAEPRPYEPAVLVEAKPEPSPDAPPVGPCPWCGRHRSRRRAPRRGRVAVAAAAR